MDVTVVEQWTGSVIAVAITLGMIVLVILGKPHDGLDAPFAVIVGLYITRSPLGKIADAIGNKPAPTPPPPTTVVVPPVAPTTPSS